MKVDYIKQKASPSFKMRLVPNLNNASHSRYDRVVELLRKKVPDLYDNLDKFGKADDEYFFHLPLKSDSIVELRRKISAKTSEVVGFALKEMNNSVEETAFSALKKFCIKDCDTDIDRGFSLISYLSGASKKLFL